MSQSRPKMSLYAALGRRKYLNAAERRRFLKALRSLPPEAQAFCLVVFWTGCRISEALALSAAAIDVDSGVIFLETLKRRQRGVVRQIPLPQHLLELLNRIFKLRKLQRDARLSIEPLWGWSRTTAWRHIKRAMASAQVCQTAAMPKGLRHSFGVTAFQANVPPHLVQRWLGHASLKTTAIYGDVMGREERLLASRLWRRR